MPGADPNAVDASDLAALWTLSVPLKWKQTKALLDDRSADIAALLSQFEDRDLADLSSDEVQDMNGDEGAAAKLWFLIREVKGMGATRTSKLMARKRPRLVPIYDSVVKATLGLDSSKDQWLQFHEALTRDNKALHKRLLALGEAAGREDLSALRVFDILVWVHGKCPKPVAGLVG